MDIVPQCSCFKGEANIGLEMVLQAATTSATDFFANCSSHHICAKAARFAHMAAIVCILDNLAFLEADISAEEMDDATAVRVSDDLWQKMKAGSLIDELDAVNSIMNQYCLRRGGGKTQ